MDGVNATDIYPTTSLHEFVLFLSVERHSGRERSHVCTGGVGTTKYYYIDGNLSFTNSNAANGGNGGNAGGEYGKQL